MKHIRIWLIGIISVFIGLFLFIKIETTINYVHGEISVNDDTFEVSDTIKCSYESASTVFEEVEGKKIDKGLSFDHRGNAGSVIYTYEFTVKGDGLILHPTIHFVKLSSNETEELKFTLDFHNENGVWDVTVNCWNGQTFKGSYEINNIEKNDIEVQFTQA